MSHAKASAKYASDKPVMTENQLSHNPGLAPAIPSQNMEQEQNLAASRNFTQPVEGVSQGKEPSAAPYGGNRQGHFDPPEEVGIDRAAAAVRYPSGVLPPNIVAQGGSAKVPTETPFMGNNVEATRCYNIAQEAPPNRQGPPDSSVLHQ